MSILTLEKEMAAPLQYSCLENPRDGGAWLVSIYGIAQSWTRLKRTVNGGLWVTITPATAGDTGGWEDPLGEEMATHSSIPAWENPMNREAWQAHSQILADFMAIGK